MNKKTLKNLNAFTLVELLIVIVVIGVLAGIMLSVMSPRHQQNIAQDAVKKSTIEKLVAGIEAYYNAEGSYPIVDTGSTNPTRPAAVGTYITTWPTNPAYWYAFSAPSTYSVTVQKSTSPDYYKYQSTTQVISECAATTGNIFSDPTACVVITGGGSPAPWCGDGTCNAGENCNTCVADCGTTCATYCGDGTCNNGETCDNCRTDCASTCPAPVVCGNGVCESGETCSSCRADCGNCGVEPICGDGICQTTYGESCSSCRTDCESLCPQVCGDGYCTGTEDCTSCLVDCQTTMECAPPCGDGICSLTEDCKLCEKDCGVCDSGKPYCGDLKCNSDEGETCTTCPKDCTLCIN